jgi:hypothetical protein
MLKMKSIITLIFIATVSLATPAAAIDEKGRWLSAGAISCEKWLEYKTLEDGFSWHRFIRTGWLAGFISGANAYRRGKADYLEGIPSRDTGIPMLWIDKYCAENPLHNTDVAAFALIKELARRP